MKGNMNVENRIMPTKRKAKFRKQKEISIDGKDLPSGTDPHGPIIITGVESEEVEGVNEAYVDILEELGITFVTNKNKLRMICLQAML